ncbi:ComEC/Rec2 family competence protein [Psychrobacter sp. JB385]|uniref:ComEC/Rec2 family competence protein n=1 Tax=Psychrobacter sp. JB385 TaxID=1434841 RepID=UPI00097ED093|nr:ComEC/Rec2 family competence protein [Psychrobacter sp. JB385]SJN20580.1 DNA internalization-related competence protein ComEC/Rec2 [Psychrobacter sp. JB385]
MYWLIVGLILIVMIGVLAVAGSIPMSLDSSLLGLTNNVSLFLFLTILSIILVIVLQFTTPSANHLESSQTSSHILPRRSTRFFCIITYTLAVMLATGLVIGSALQAISSYQQAKATEVVEPVRVQALVTIEGVSDSVYDASATSGYRQVAIISQISPLVADLSTQDLNKITDKYVIDNKNSLSNNTSTHNPAHEYSSKNATYRILLNAYPKNPSKSSLGKPSNDSQLTRLNHLKPGDQLFMSLALAPLATAEQTINNPSGFDGYRWLKARHVDGVANILATGTVTVPEVNSASVSSDNAYLHNFRTRIDQGRWYLRQHFYENWSELSVIDQQARAVTLSLLTGDRSLINRDTKDLYQLAGISHLLAISGTHILFLAIMLSACAVFLFDRLYPMMYRAVPRWQLRWGVMVGAAFVYALFTGFDVPAARTAWMLLALGLVRLTLRPISTIRVLFALAVLMAWHDPYVLWQAGYWLSFIAVALLLKYDDTSNRYTQSDTTHNVGLKNAFSKRMWGTSKRLFKLQFWLFITLLPITLLLFGKASLWGLIINLFAIGLFGWVIVPLNLLAGLCYLLSPTIADSIWTLVITIVAHLHELIIWLTSLPSLSKAWLYTPVNTAIVLMVLLSLVPWLLPRGFVSRWLALPPLTLLMMTVYANQQSPKTIPTLYILPTGDRYVSAALLQYSNGSNERASKNKNTNWLFLAHHRPTDLRTMPSKLTSDKLSEIIEQQLGSLSVDALEGIIVQSGDAGLTTTLNIDDKHTTPDIRQSEVLPMSVAQLAARIPIGQYWQAGRSDRWGSLQQAYQTINHSEGKLGVNTQPCEQGKTWQLPNGELTIQALTGWSKVGDASVWDCTIALDTSLPIQILKYDASQPLKSLPSTIQTRISNDHSTVQQIDDSSSRLILNTDTHQHVWQMWSLLCSADAFNNQNSSNTTWLGHSESQITTEILKHQGVDAIITYDEKGLEAALPLGEIGNESSQK